MSTFDPLTDRIRAEFSQMTGLKLTLEQACRLWHSNQTQCEAALERLVTDGFLRRSASGGFFALPSQRVRSLRPVAVNDARLSRCPHCRHMNSLESETTVSPRSTSTTFRCSACSRVVTLTRIPA